MKFQFNENDDNDMGTLTVTAENAAEVVELVKHFRIYDPYTIEGAAKLAQAITTGEFSYTSGATKKNWVAVESALSHEFFEPYAKALRDYCGYHGQFPSFIDLTPFHPRRLCHTHITDSISLQGIYIVYSGYMQNHYTDREDGIDRTIKNSEDYTAEDFGDRYHEPEYITAGNNARVRNPNWYKRHPAKPAFTAGWLWKVLAQWWIDNHATDKQKELLASALVVKENPLWGRYGNLPDYSGFYHSDPNGKVNWDSKGTKVGHMQWKEFIALGKGIGE